MGQNELAEEIASFEGLWKGGYFEGDPLDPLARSTFGNFGYISVLYATYLVCIKPYVSADTRALEIGPGRGAWTKTMLAAKEVWTLDALSAEYNGFFEYLNHPTNVRYIQVSDFECRDLPDGYFDFLFSFGCLCHVSFEGISAYAKNLFPKLASGAHCFWLVADKAKYARFVENEKRFDIWRALMPTRKRLTPVKKLLEAFSSATRPSFLTTDVFAEGQGHWHDAGAARTCEMLEAAGYKVIDSDVGVLPRDPIIHFMKP